MISVISLFLRKDRAVIVLLSIISLSLYSQSVTSPIILASGGGSSNDKSAVSWSLGDLVINSIEGNASSILNGSQFDLEVITAIEKAIPEIQIFPNPVAQFLNIELKEEISETVYIRIYDAKGVKFFQKDINLNHDSEIQFDFTGMNLPLGMWLLEIQSLDGTHFYKLIKN